MRKIGLFAGAFDPIHDGHLEVARLAVKHLELDELVFMVESSPWGTKKPAMHHHRQAMIDLAVAEFHKINQLKGIGDHFTVEKTLPLIEDIFKSDELYFIFGADVFLQMNPSKWPGLGKLLEHYIVVFERGDITELEISEHAKTLGIATAIIPSPHPNHSSTDVRLKPHDKTVWVPRKVADYIDQHKLY